MMFYVYYFGHLEFEDCYLSISSQIQKGEISRKVVWDKLGKYVLPEMGFQSGYSKVKSINKTFLKQICNSDKFVKLIVSILLQSLLFMGSYWKCDWTPNCNYFSNKRKDNIGSKLLSISQKTNTKEIMKLFKELENQIISKSTYVDVECEKSFKNSFDLIKTHVKRKNLKMPWTFMEIENSLIECLIVIIESKHICDQSKKLFEIF
jgi:hypothetical protein